MKYIWERKNWFDFESDEAALLGPLSQLRVLEGKLPSRALGLVVEWASQHQEELMMNWEAARNDRPPQKIQPLQ